MYNPGSLYTQGPVQRLLFFGSSYSFSYRLPLPLLLLTLMTVQFFSKGSALLQWRHSLCVCRSDLQAPYCSIDEVKEKRVVLAPGAVSSMSRPPVTKSDERQRRQCRGHRLGDEAVRYLPCSSLASEGWRGLMVNFLCCKENRKSARVVVGEQNIL